MNEIGEETEESIPKGISAYLRTRLQLVSIETQEACAYAKGKAAPTVIALICAVSSYSLILTAIVSLLGKLLEKMGEHLLLGWETAALLVAALHIVIIFTMKKRICRKPSSPLYEYSRAELERDREWIQENNPKSKN